MVEVPKGSSHKTTEANLLTKDIRLLSCFFISELAKLVKPPVPPAAINTAKSFFHRFYKHQSIHKQKNFKLVCVTCLFSACKAEECPRPLKEIIWAWNQAELDPKSRKPCFPLGRYQEDDGKKELEQNTAYQEMRKNVLSGERILLHVLGFEFPLYNPEQYIPRILKFFDACKGEKGQKLFEKNDWTPFGNLVMTTAHSMINDLSCTPACIECRPVVIAAACVSLALKTLKFDMAPLDKWIPELNAKQHSYRSKELDHAWWKNVDDIAKDDVKVVWSKLVGLYEEAAVDDPDKLDRLEAGEIVQVKGSGGRPYQLQKKGNVYSCSCSIWRHIDDIEQRRTCRHLQQLRGDMAETGRVGEEGVRKMEEKLTELSAAPRINSASASEASPAAGAAGSASSRPASASPGHANKRSAHAPPPQPAKRQHST